MTARSPNPSAAQRPSTVPLKTALIDIYRGFLDVSHNGLALLGTIGANLAVATAEGEHREAAVVTLLVTASGISFFGIAAAFWGIIAGGLTLLLVSIKFPLLMLLGRTLGGLPTLSALRLGAVLAAGGEFAFVVFKLALEHQVSYWPSLAF